MVGLYVWLVRQISSTTKYIDLLLVYAVIIINYPLIWCQNSFFKSYKYVQLPYISCFTIYIIICFFNFTYHIAFQWVLGIWYFLLLKRLCSKTNLYTYLYTQTTGDKSNINKKIMPSWSRHNFCVKKYSALIY